VSLCIQLQNSITLMDRKLDILPSLSLIMFASSYYLLYHFLVILSSLICSDNKLIIECFLISRTWDVPHVMLQLIFQSYLYWLFSHLAEGFILVLDMALCI